MYGILNKEYISLPLSEQYKIVKDKFIERCKNKQLGDEYLIKNECTPRNLISGNICGDFDYGIVYLRDDAVEVLLKYIEELKRKVDEK